jgi:hypothetical protein
MGTGKLGRIGLERAQRYEGAIPGEVIQIVGAAPTNRCRWSESAGSFTSMVGQGVSTTLPGMCWVALAMNASTPDPAMPTGGYKQSGWGRELRPGWHRPLLRGQVGIHTPMIER